MQGKHIIVLVYQTIDTSGNFIQIQNKLKKIREIHNVKI